MLKILRFHSTNNTLTAFAFYSYDSDNMQAALRIELHRSFVLIEIMTDSFEKDSDLPRCWHSCASDRLGSDAELSY